MTPEGLQQGLVIGHTTSATEQIAHWAIGAHVVKAFNTTGWQNMADPLYGSPGLAMLLCGDQAEPKEVVAVLAKQLGFEPVDVGPPARPGILRHWRCGGLRWLFSKAGSD
jgi:predicted dinucleotide-binding enzyme